ncbi:hypothetical protein D9M73_288820 [compost metagenome]
MSAGELHADFCLGGQNLDGFLTLAHKLDKLQTFRAGYGFPDARDLLVQVVL